MLFPNVQIRILFVPFGVKAKYFVILYGLYELYAGMSISDDVAHFAHLGGIALGYIFTKLFRMF
jgi:membrane associated rhomboid family serine protease